MITNDQKQILLAVIGQLNTNEGIPLAVHTAYIAMINITCGYELSSTLHLASQKCNPNLKGNVNLLQDVSPDGGSISNEEWMYALLRTCKMCLFGYTRDEIIPAESSGPTV